MERPTAKSPQDSSFLRTPSSHTFVTYSTSSTSNLASTFRELPRAAIGNGSKCHLHEVRRYSRWVLPFVSALVEAAPGRLHRESEEGASAAPPLGLLVVIQPKSR